MLIMTAKVDKRKIILALGALIVAIVLLFSMMGGDAQPTASTAVSGATNDDRVKFLTDLGWEVTTSPTESMEIRIPKDSGDVFSRYNQLQLSQGFDLTKYAGKKAMRYVYRINNYPNASAPVYATILVYKDKIIGGDITDTSSNGKIHGFTMPSQP